MRERTGGPFDKWLQQSLAEDPDLAARVKKRLAEMRIEQGLVALRQSRGLTQAQLGRMLGISQPAVARMETEGGNLEIRTLVRVAEVLEARLEVRLVSMPRRSSVHSTQPYAPGSAAPSFVQEIKDSYGAANRRKPAPTRKRFLSTPRTRRAVSDRATLDALRSSLRDIQTGNVHSLDEVATRLALARAARPRKSGGGRVAPKKKK